MAQVALKRSMVAASAGTHIPDSPAPPPPPRLGSLGWPARPFPEKWCSFRHHSIFAHRERESLVPLRFSGTVALPVKCRRTSATERNPGLVRAGKERHGSVFWSSTSFSASVVVWENRGCCVSVVRRRSGWRLKQQRGLEKMDSAMCVFREQVPEIRIDRPFVHEQRHCRVRMVRPERWVAGRGKREMKLDPPTRQTRLQSGMADMRRASPIDLD